jgi:hypothetical protein
VVGDAAVEVVVEVDEEVEADIEEEVEDEKEERGDCLLKRLFISGVAGMEEEDIGLGGRERGV